jgi:hypothetical protein
MPKRQRIDSTAWKKIAKDPVLFCDHFLWSGPHPGQATWLRNSVFPMNILVPGNRWGKTYVIAMKHIWSNIFKKGLPKMSANAWLSAPYQTVSTAPSFDQAGLVYKAAKQLLSTEAMKPLVKKYRATPFPSIEFWNGSVLHVRSLHDDARYVDGHGYQYLSIDEAGWIPNLRKLVDSVLLMRLAGGGSLDFIGTPKGKSQDGLFWYYMQGFRGVEGYYSQRGSIFDNPYLPREDLEMRARLLGGSDDKLKQQVLYGEFIDFEGLAFTGDQLENAFRDDLPTELPPLADHRYVTAWDLGRTNDFTVGCTLDITKRPWTLVRFDRLNKVPWEQIYALIGEVRNLYGCRWAYIDATGPQGDVIEEEMLKRRIPVSGVKTNSKAAKLTLINGLQAAFDEGRRVIGAAEVMDHTGVVVSRPKLEPALDGEWGLLRMPMHKQLLTELETYQLDDKKLVQDSVFALALAVAGARELEYVGAPVLGGLYWDGRK